MEKPLKISLQIISPVHIGCDDVYEPTGFVIDEKKKKLIAFDALTFIKSLSADERKQFSELCMQGDVASIPNLYRFIGSKKIEGREIDIAQGLPASYQRVKDLVKSKDEKKIKQELNQFAIKRTAYNPHNDLPYIPGSSLKGALRTAYLNMLAEQTGITGWTGKAKDLEIKLMNGSFDTDPFRLVKVSDFLPAGDVKTKIVYAVNKKKMLSKFEARGPYQIFEVIQPGAIFEGTISILEPPPKAGIKKAVTEQDLLAALKDFYGAAFDLECTLMKGIGADCGVYARLKDEYKDIFNEKAFLVRAGRHSGAEAVTIEGSRTIKIMQGKGKPPKYQESSNTLWLASEYSKINSNAALLPFGWLLLSTVNLKASSGVVPVGESRQPAAPPKPPAPPIRPVDTFITQIKSRKPTDAGAIGTIINDALSKLESNEDKKEFAQAVKAHMGADFKKSKAKTKLEGYIE